MTMSCCFKSLFGVEPRSEADAFILLTLFMCYDYAWRKQELSFCKTEDKGGGINSTENT